jgi:hypothetical protein
MPSRKKIDLEKVLACMNTKCSKCGHEIEPEKIRRVSSEEMEVSGMCLAVPTDKSS